MQITSQYIISFLRSNHHVLEMYGVKRIGVFGSYARGDFNGASDIDIVVDLPSPSFLNMMELILFLERGLGKSVDVVRLGAHIRPEFVKTIEKEVIYA